MKPVELYARVRHACHVEGMSQREAARRFGIDPKTVAKLLRHAVPPGYRRIMPPVRPWLTVVIDDHSRAVAGYGLALTEPTVSGGEKIPH